MLDIETGSIIQMRVNTCQMYERRSPLRLIGDSLCIRPLGFYDY